MENFVDYCKNYILEHIEEYEGQSCFGCDWGYELTQGPNNDGTLTYSRALAIDYLREWWYECGEYWEYERENFGENTHNPFDNPEAYMVCMVIEGVNLILPRCDVIETNWNVELRMTPDVIKEITSFVEDFDEESLF